MADSKRERARRETRRRFEQWARNPECHSNVTSAVHNVKMGAAARRENPNAPRDAQSVFALERGNAFEASLINDGAPILLEALRGAEVISSTSNDFADHRTTRNGGPLASLDTATEVGLLALSATAAAGTEISAEMKVATTSQDLVLGNIFFKSINTAKLTQTLITAILKILKPSAVNPPSANKNA